MAGGGGVCRVWDYYFLFYCFPKAYICEIYVKYTLKSKQIYPWRVFLCQLWVNSMAISSQFYVKTPLRNLYFSFNMGLPPPPPFWTMFKQTVELVKRYIPNKDRSISQNYHKKQIQRGLNKQEEIINKYQPKRFLRTGTTKIKTTLYCSINVIASN